MTELPTGTPGRNCVHTGRSSAQPPAGNLTINLMITQKINVKKLVLAAAASLGLVASAAAQSMPAAASAGGGLLGQNYAGVEYAYVRLNDGPPKVAHDYGFLFNQSLTDGLDLGVSYDYLHASALGMNVSQSTLGLALTGYIKQDWGKPFLQAGAGWMWQKGGRVNDNSFVYLVGTGVEFPVGTAWAVAPFVNYRDARDIAGAHEWNYGVKTNYRISKEWSTSFTISRNDDKDMRYAIGVNYHF